MAYKYSHISNTICSSINISSTPEKIWENITNVKIEAFTDPFIFKILDIPKPVKADIMTEGKGDKRIVYFNSGKKFMKEILDWNQFTEYSFSFNPEKGFRVCYFFELSEGIFQILKGAYRLKTQGQATSLELITTYSIDGRFYPLLNFPVRLILKAFQKYLLTSIKKNSE